MSFNIVAHKVGEAGQCSSKRKGVSMATLACKRPLPDTLWRTASKQLCTSHKVPLLDQRCGANPSIVGKTADQHWLEVNFAQITFSHIDILWQHNETPFWTNH